MGANPRPIALAERIQLLDVIRGVALLGIFIVNMPFFNSSAFAYQDASALWPAWWDRTAAVVRDVLFSGKFNSMFSLLFAVGFTIQLERLRERGPERSLSLYIKRILWLFVFGVVHACVFWYGDVLHVYAVLGIALIVIRRWSDRAIYMLIVACFLYPVIGDVIRALAWSPDDTERFTALYQSWVKSDNLAYGHGAFVQAAHQHTKVMAFHYTDPDGIYFHSTFYAQMLTTVAIGLLLGRHHVFQGVAAWLPQIRRAQWIGLVVGVGGGAIFGLWEVTVQNPYDPSYASAMATIGYMLSRLGIMTFYVATIVRGMQVSNWRARLSLMAIPGRMPLSNYLLQTLMGTFIFYGWGLGFWGKAGPALSLLLPFVLFFGVQVPLSWLWLRRFERGPMEYLWRVLIYGRRALHPIKSSRDTAMLRSDS